MFLPSAPHGLPHRVTILATWFGTGLLPKAPGTWGSLGALPLAFALYVMGGPVLLLVSALIVFLAGIWAAKRYADGVEETDPSEVVIDEVAALWLALAFAEPTWLGWIAAFVLFRFFDIVKPWPIKLVERSFGGGLGIMADDVAAAIYVIAIMLLSRQFLGVL